MMERGPKDPEVQKAIREYRGSGPHPVVQGRFVNTPVASSL